MSNGHRPERPGLSSKRRRILGVIVLVCLALPFPVAAQTKGSDPATPGKAFSTDRSDYVIGLQDLLEVTVFGVDELDKIVRVSDDGTISLPLLGRLDVVGLTKSDLQDLIARHLAEGSFVKNPQVSVFVIEYESKKIAVTGAVRQPGAYEMLGRKTLLEMISRAGGLIERDVASEIVVFRRLDDGTTNRIAIDLRKLVYDADPSLNLVVEPSDIIYVPAVEKMEIFVTGAVNSPDRFYVRRDKSITVLRAVTLAGGAAPRASLKHVQVLRTRPDGSKVTLVVNLKKAQQGKAEDLVLREDDVVMVPKSFF
jgi:polysaccharide export outer membrane protein